MFSMTENTQFQSRPKHPPPLFVPLPLHLMHPQSQINDNLDLFPRRLSPSSVTGEVPSTQFPISRTYLNKNVYLNIQLYVSENQSAKPLSQLSRIYSSILTFSICRCARTEQYIEIHIPKRLTLY
jgi:hypothetical protein